MGALEVGQVLLARSQSHSDHSALAGLALAAMPLSAASGGQMPGGPRHVRAQSIGAGKEASSCSPASFEYEYESSTSEGAFVERQIPDGKGPAGDAIAVAKSAVQPVITTVRTPASTAAINR